MAYKENIPAVDHTRHITDNEVFYAALSFLIAIGVSYPAVHVRFRRAD